MGILAFIVLVVGCWIVDAFFSNRKGVTQAIINQKKFEKWWEKENGRPYYRLPKTKE